MSLQCGGTAGGHGAVGQLEGHGSRGGMAGGHGAVGWLEDTVRREAGGTRCGVKLEGCNAVRCEGRDVQSL